jgi:hypothetical protein
LSCSLKLSTSTPRGYADRLSVVRTTEYVAIDQSSDRVDRNVLLTHPARSSRANDPKRCRSRTDCRLPSTDLLGPGRHARERLELCPPSGGEPMKRGPALCSSACCERNLSPGQWRAWEPSIRFAPRRRCRRGRGLASEST